MCEMRNVIYVEGMLTNMTGNAFWRNVGSTIVNMTVSETDVSDSLQMTWNGFYENYGMTPIPTYCTHSVRITGNSLSLLCPLLLDSDQLDAPLDRLPPELHVQADQQLLQQSAQRFRAADRQHDHHRHVAHHHQSAHTCRSLITITFLLDFCTCVN